MTHWTTGLYDLAVARSGQPVRSRRSGRTGVRRIPDRIVLQLRRIYEGAPYGRKRLALYKACKLYNINQNTALSIISYCARSSPNYPLDPSLQRGKQSVAPGEPNARPGVQPHQASHSRKGGNYDTK